MIRMSVLLAHVGPIMGGELFRTTERSRRPDITVGLSNLEFESMKRPEKITVTIEAGNTMSRSATRDLDELDEILAKANGGPAQIGRSWDDNWGMGV